jgi:hypothetical protein
MLGTALVTTFPVNLRFSREIMSSRCGRRRATVDDFHQPISPLLHTNRTDDCRRSVTCIF